MKYKFRYTLFLLFFITQGFAAPGKFKKTADGVIVYLDQTIPGNTSVVRLQVINNNIIRVTASSTPQLPDVTSLITVLNKPLASVWSVVKNGDNVLLKTSAVTASINLLTGAVKAQTSSLKFQPHLMKQLH